MQLIRESTNFDESFVFNLILLLVHLNLEFNNWYTLLGKYLCEFKYLISSIFKESIEDEVSKIAEVNKLIQGSSLNLSKGFV